MFVGLLAADDTGNWFSNYGMFIIIAVVLVLMIVLTIVPQKKRQKQQQQMMDSLRIGTKIMTIGRMVGKITQINADNTFVINVGTDESPTYIVIDKNAVGLVLENVPAPVEEVPATVEETSADETDLTVEETSADEAIVTEEADLTVDSDK